MAIELKIDPEIMNQIIEESIRCYPEEACGFILGNIGKAREAEEFIACQNIQNELHAKDSNRYPRTAETAYVIDPREQEDMEKRAKFHGLKILAIFHSHPEHDCYFSKEDRENAAPWGEPLFPNMSYLVVSVFDEEIKAVSDYFWDEESKDFIEFSYDV